MLRSLVSPRMLRISLLIANEMLKQYNAELTIRLNVSEEAAEDLKYRHDLTITELMTTIKELADKVQAQES
eukprot:9234841-Heterocapsa_arctica.AAC.1